MLTNMIAGCIPANDTAPEQAVYFVAREALDTHRVHTLIARDGGHLYYLAVPSADLASSTDTRTALAAALPGHPSHQGDAAYVLHGGEDSIAIIRRGASLRLLSNSAEVIADAVAAEDLPVVNVAEALPGQLTTVAGKHRAQGSKLAGTLTTVSMIWALVASLAAGGLAAANGMTHTGDKDQLDHLARIVAEVKTGQPMAEDLAKVQALSSIVAAKAGGWIEYYSVEKGQVSYEVRLPAWVAPEVIASLGPGIKTDLDRSANLIVVTKGTKK